MPDPVNEGLNKVVRELVKDSLSSFVDAQCREAVLADPETPEDLFHDGFCRGYSRAVLDITVGRLQIKMFEIGKGKGE